MSASRAAAEACPNCGADVPGRARYCSECGAALESAAGTTMRVELPPEETGPVPVTVVRSEPHWFGVPPTGWLLGLTAGALLLAIVLFAAGRWPYGLIFLGVVALLATALLEAARRRPRSTLTRATVDARDRAASLLETWRARSAAALDARRVQSGLALIEAERRRVVFELGDAAHRGDGMAEAGARARLEELDAREQDLRRLQAEGLEAVGERIRRARLSVDQTIMVAPSYPPPDEGNPPDPPRIPEPYPPPDEGTPPTPDDDDED
jgi:hypothetical protein